MQKKPDNKAPKKIKSTLGVAETKKAVDGLLSNWEKLSPSMQSVVALTIPYAANGCNWTIISDKDERYEAILDLENDPEVAKNANFYPVKGGVFVTLSESVSQDAYYSYVQAVAGNQELFGVKHIARAKQFREASLANFNEYIKSLTVRGARSATVGIYNCNDTNTLTVNGKSLNAYNVTVEEAAIILSNYGWGVMVNGKPVKPQSIRANKKAFLKTVKAAPSLRGLLIDIVR